MAVKLKTHEIDPRDKSISRCGKPEGMVRIVESDPTCKHCINLKAGKNNRSMPRLCFNRNSQHR